MSEPTLAELNAHLFAAVLGKPRLATSASKGRGKKETARAAQDAPAEMPAAPAFSAEQLAACKAAGVDPASLSADELAAVVAAANMGK